jgi:hypothetical protein
MCIRILLALLIVGGTAQASEWVSLGKEGSGTETFADVSSIRISGTVRRAWIKSVFKEHTERNYEGDKWQSFAMVLDAFNCSAETMTSEAMSIYFEDQTSYSVNPNLFPWPWNPVVPDTWGSTSFSLSVRGSRNEVAAAPIVLWLRQKLAHVARFCIPYFPRI